MLPRHSIVRLTEAGWRDAEQSACEASLTALATWRHEDLPLIARRQEPDVDDRHCCLGLAMPPDPETGEKRRYPLRAAVANLREVIPPLPLGEAISAAPTTWQAGLRELDARANAHGLVLRVYGSLALQKLTGKTYLSVSSDIDLLLSPATREQLETGIALLSDVATALPLDGEVVFPGGDAVAWREWLGAGQAARGTRVLAKSVRGVALRKPDELLATLDEAPCMP